MFGLGLAMDESNRDDDAKLRMEQVPPPYRQVAVTGTEEWVKDQGVDRVTAKHVDDLRKEMGM